MSKLSKEAFAITAMCEETKRPFGITVNPDKGCYAFTWAFKMKDGQAKREGYDKTRVRGAVVLDPEYNGCPYCGAKNFYQCSCGMTVCYHGQKVVTCPNCKATGEVMVAEAIDLSGGGM